MRPQIFCEAEAKAYATYKYISVSYHILYIIKPISVRQKQLT